MCVRLMIQIGDLFETCLAPALPVPHLQIGGGADRRPQLCCPGVQPHTRPRHMPRPHCCHDLEKAVKKHFVVSTKATQQTSWGSGIWNIPGLQLLDDS